LKVLAIIQARMGSTRLPGKVLRLIQGKSMLEHQIDFLKKSESINQLIVATTKLAQDDKIEELVNELGIDCYRGSTDDVLERYYKCAKKFNGEIIVRITSDNPLVEPTLVDKIIELAIDTKCDFATNMIKQTYPLGYLVEVFPFQVLEKLYNEKVILDHGMEVGKELANVLSGGDTTIEKTLSEDDLYKLELDSFMKLIQTKKTQERIKHTLATGKPLVN